MNPFIVRSFALLAALSLTTTATASPQARPESEQQHGEADRIGNQAIDAFNLGNLGEAKRILKDLLTRYPETFWAYPTYWESVGRTEDADVLRATVKADVEHLERVPTDRRDEDFYDALLNAYETVLADPNRIGELEKEATSQFPRGRRVQSAVLDAARAEQDPTRAVGKYQAYIDAFPENVSWTQSAADGAFFAALRNRDRFDSATILRLCEQRERLNKRFVDTFGNPYRNVAALAQITDALAETNPPEALRYARLGLRFVEEHWISAEDFSDEARLLFYPAILRAHSALQAWLDVRKVGAALVREIESGHAVGNGFRPGDEAAIRYNFGRALEGTGDVEAARLQIAWAAALDQSLAGERDAFTARHVMDAASTASFYKMLKARMADVAARQEGRQRSELLRTEQRRPAPGFTLRNLNGKSVSLAELRGKVVVLTVWAAWCSPCIAELEEWRVAVANYRADPDVALFAINIDTDKAAARAFAEKKRYEFPILLSDGSVESGYSTQSIPHIVVIDREGFVVFEVTGYSNDGLYLKKLGWMISAAME